MSKSDSNSEPNDSPAHLRQKVHEALSGEGPYGKPTVIAIYALIMISVALIMLATVESVNMRFSGWILGCETVFTGFFAVEYGLRVWSAPNRVKYIFSLWGIIDLLAALPILILFGGHLAVLKSFRVLRVVQVLKLLRMASAYQRLVVAFVSVKEELFVFMMLTVILLIISSMGIYYFEHPAQPEKFSSIPASFWWGITTFTTVGYGDVYPVTLGGKIFTFFILLLALSILAVPTGIFSAALMATKQEARRNEAKSDKTDASA